jgi:amidohydrolase
MNHNDPLNKIRTRSQAIIAELIEIRRDLHRHPELSNREFRTSEKVATFLRELGIPTQTGVAKTGVVALLEGMHPGPTVAVRADMDALPIQETLDVPYRSRNEGVKHGCGHDVHTTVALGVAKTLWTLEEYLHGRIKFIFQPAEEDIPAGEEGGAALMLKEKVFENPTVDAIFALHVMPAIHVGKFGYHDGAVWASNDFLEITIHGRKTHGAYPHTGVDAIVVASHVVIALETMVSRAVDPREPFLISIGVMQGGTQFNIIADEVHLVGMVRCLNPDVRAAAPGRIEAVVRGVTQAFDASYTLRLTPRSPVTMNAPELVRMSLSVLQATFGTENVLLQKPHMGSEDFALFAERVPGFYFFLGVRNESKGIISMLHTPEFDVDESCISLGVEAMSLLVVEYLSQGSTT